MKIQHKMLLLAVCFALACRETPVAENHPAEKQTADQPDGISLTTEQIKTAGIEWGLPAKPDAVSTLDVELNGELVIHPEHQAIVATTGEGILEALLVQRNQAVKKGAAIATLRRAELLDWQQQFLEIRARLPFLQAEYERYKALQQADAGARKLFQRAEADLRETQATQSSLSAKLQLYGIDAESLRLDNMSATAVLRAPLSGRVVEIQASPGVALTAGTPVCTIVERSRMHADLWLYEKDLAVVRSSQSVSISAADGSIVQGSVLNIDPVVDPERHAVRVHVAGAWPDHWPEGAFVSAHLSTPATPTSEAWVIPSDAVVVEPEGAFIFLHRQTTEKGVFFEKVAVRTQKRADARMLVFPQIPVPSGTAVVLKGAYYVAAHGAGVSVEE